MNVAGFLRNQDRIFALLMIAISSVMYGLIGGMEEAYSPGALAASTYPRLLLGCIIFVSCLLIIRPIKPDKNQERFSLQGMFVIIFMATYIALLETVGFFILTPAFLFILPLIAGFRRYGLITLSVILVTAALYGVFVEVLNIPLPQGLLGD
jgi:hypothetical protein